MVQPIHRSPCKPTRADNVMTSRPSNLPRPRIHRGADLRARQTLVSRVGSRSRNLARSVFGMFAGPPADKEWVAFQFYHWVLDDERKAFQRQLKLLRHYGDFISVDDAVAALQSPGGIGGRYFCLTFDDGFKNWFTNAVPILTESDVPAAFFLPTKYIGLDLEGDWEQIKPFYERSWTQYGGYFDFLNWDECRQMAAAGFTLGSHTHSHPRLTNLQPAEAELELSLSKAIIESELGQPCRHFCCPWGKPNKDFDPVLHPNMAQRLGYVSFLTTEDGLNLPGHSAFRIARTSSTASQGPSLLRYTLFPSWFRSLRARFA